MDERGHLAEAFNMRIDELNVIDMAFLEGCSRPTIGALNPGPWDASTVCWEQRHAFPMALKAQWACTLAL